MTETRTVDGREFTVRNLDVEDLTPKERRLEKQPRRKDTTGYIEALADNHGIDGLEEHLKELKDSMEREESEETKKRIGLEILNTTAVLEELRETQRQGERRWTPADFERMSLGLGSDEIDEINESRKENPDEDKD